MYEHLIKKSNYDTGKEITLIITMMYFNKEIKHIYLLTGLY